MFSKINSYCFFTLVQYVLNKEETIETSVLKSAAVFPIVNVPSRSKVYEILAVFDIHFGFTWKIYE